MLGTFRAVIPKIAPIIARKWEVCNPDPSTTGIKAGGFKLDKVIVPLLILLTFWKEILLALAVLLFPLWMRRRSQAATRLK